MPANTPGFQPPPPRPPPPGGVRLAPPSHLGLEDWISPGTALSPSVREGAARSSGCISVALLKTRKYKNCKGKGVRGPWGPWSWYGPDPESTSPLRR